MIKYLLASIFICIKRRTEWINDWNTRNSERMRTRGASERTSDLCKWNGSEHTSMDWNDKDDERERKKNCVRDKTQKNNVFIFSFTVELVCLGSDFSCLCKFCIYFIAGAFSPHFFVSFVVVVVVVYFSLTFLLSFVLAAQFSIIDKFLFALCLQSAGV